MALMYLNCSIKERRKRNSMSYVNLVLGRAVAPSDFKRNYLTNFMQLQCVTSREAKDCGVMTKKVQQRHEADIQHRWNLLQNIISVSTLFDFNIFTIPFTKEKCSNVHKHNNLNWNWWRMNNIAIKFSKYRDHWNGAIMQ
jgi:hypothetical protein